LAINNVASVASFTTSSSLIFACPLWLQRRRITKTTYQVFAASPDDPGAACTAESIQRFDISNQRFNESRLPFVAIDGKVLPKDVRFFLARSIRLWA